MSAVATSGAAFSPAMGRMTMQSLRMLMAVLNLRLGLWLPNPLWARDKHLRDELGVARVFPYFFREMLGTHRLTDEYLYITDGGHWDNLGLVEALRRRCRVIFCFDAAGDQVRTFNTIGEAMSLARSELGIEIDLHPEHMAPRSKPKKGQPDISAKEFAIGTIIYPDIPEPGKLIFCKAAVTATAPWEIRSYQDAIRCSPTTQPCFRCSTTNASRPTGRSVSTRQRWRTAQQRKEASSRSINPDGFDSSPRRVRSTDIGVE